MQVNDKYLIGERSHTLTKIEGEQLTFQNDRDSSKGYLLNKGIFEWFKDHGVIERGFIDSIFGGIN